MKKCRARRLRILFMKPHQKHHGFHSHNIKHNLRGITHALSMRLVTFHTCDFDLSRSMESHIQTAPSLPVFRKVTVLSVVWTIFSFVMSNQLQNSFCAKPRRPRSLHPCDFDLIWRLEGHLLSITSWQTFAKMQLFRNFIFSVNPILCES